MTNEPANETDRPPSDPPETARGTDESANASILQNAFWCVAIAAAAFLFYALKVESSLFRAITLQLAVCGVAVWAAINASKIRRKLPGVDDDEVLPLKREATSMHYLFVASPLVAIVVLASLSMLAQLVEVAVPRSPQEVVTGAILAILVGSLWTVFVRALDRRSDAAAESARANFPESGAIQAALSESRLAALVSGGVLMAATSTVSSNRSADSPWPAASSAR